MKAPELIGMDISTARRTLGYWWVLDTQNVNCGIGTYIFFRPARGRVELHTENNIVKSVYPTWMEIVDKKEE